MLDLHGYLPEVSVTAVNCCLYHQGRYTHPIAQRTVLPNKRCILLKDDPRVGSCCMQTAWPKVEQPPRYP